MKVVDLGLIEYQQATEYQLECVEKVYQHPHEELILFCTHPPVVTVGRATQGKDLYAWDGELIETSRGGRATYHGPNQLVMYPITNLSNENRIFLKQRDLHTYLRLLERSVIDTLMLYDVMADAKTISAQDDQGHKLEVTGVWVGDYKIASIGIAVKKWITYHGVAINLDYDPNAFKGINPCGFSSQIMVSLEQVLNHKVDRELFQKQWAQRLTDLLKVKHADLSAARLG